MQPGVRKEIEMSRVALAVGLLLVCGTACGQQTEYESFEDAVPAYVKAARAGSLSVSPWHSKHGQNSLRWEWAQGEDLVIRRGIGDVSRAGGFLCRASFVVWLYMEKPIPGVLVFEFREGEKATGSFRFPLTFGGWRQARIFYHEFPNGRPTSKVDNIRVVAPADAAKGTVFIDFLGYNAQLPWALYGAGQPGNPGGGKSRKRSGQRM
jgi:hypothetical protein